MAAHWAGSSVARKGTQRAVHSVASMVVPKAVLTAQTTVGRWVETLAVGKVVSWAVCWAVHWAARMAEHSAELWAE